VYTPAPGESFREDQLPARLGMLRMPRWAATLVFGGLFVVAIAAMAIAIAVNFYDSSIISNGAAIALFSIAPTAAIIGGVFLWHTSEWLTLTYDEAIVTTAFLGRRRILRAQIVDFQAYQHQYATRYGVRYRMVPTFTITDIYDRLRDVPLQFLSYRDGSRRGAVPLSAKAAYLEAWARSGSNAYSRAVAGGAASEQIVTHRLATRQGIRRRAVVSAILIPVLSIGIGLGLGFGLGPASQAFGWNIDRSTGSVDAQTDRTGVRDLSDSLTPRMTSYQWTEQPTTPGTTNVQLLPQLAAMPASGTLHYFIRDPAQRNGKGLSPEEQKLGQIVSQGTIAEAGQWLLFALDDGDTKFTLELYVTDAHGHTTRDSDIYKDLGGPAPAQTPATP